MSNANASSSNPGNKPSGDKELKRMRVEPGARIPRSVTLNMDTGMTLLSAEVRDQILRLPDNLYDGEATMIISGDIARDGVSPTRAIGFERRFNGSARVDWAVDWAWRVPSKWVHNEKRRSPDAFVGALVFLETDGDKDASEIERWTHLEITSVTSHAVAARRSFVVHVGRFIYEPQELADYYRKVYSQVLFGSKSVTSNRVKGRYTALLNTFTADNVARLCEGVDFVNYAADAEPGEPVADAGEGEGEPEQVDEVAVAAVQPRAAQGFRASNPT